MANCSYCDSFILFGGRTDASGRYCNEKCQRAGNLIAISNQIPSADLDRLMEEIRHANCPRCGSPGSIDMHRAHRVWSALVLTSWSSSPALSCRSCALKRQLGSIAFCAVFGWWGFPWGIIMTPVQIVRNVAEMTGRGGSDEPSPLLRKYVRLRAAMEWVQRAQPARSASPPPVPARATPPVPAPVGDERYMPK